MGNDVPSPQHEAALAEMLLLLDSWTLRLRTERKSPHTIASYQDGVKAFLRWCAGSGTRPALAKAVVGAFVVDLLEAGAAPSTAASRHISCRQFSAFLLAEGEIDADELKGVPPPKLDDVLVDPLNPDEIAALLKACKGRELADLRDEAVVRFMVETPSRASEVVGMLLSRTRILEGTTVLFGKGGIERLVPFSPYTAQAIDRYVRARRRHPLAAGDRLWLGAKGRTWNYPGLYYALGQRAAAAGIAGFHPHRLRHTSADRWLDAGGSEGGLKAVAGWKSDDMLRRYTKRRAAVRAIDEARRLNLGDF